MTINTKRALLEAAATAQRAAQRAAEAAQRAAAEAAQYAAAAFEEAAQSVEEVAQFVEAARARAAAAQGAASAAALEVTKATAAETGWFHCSWGAHDEATLLIACADHGIAAKDVDSEQGIANLALPPDLVDQLQRDGFLTLDFHGATIWVELP
jgi:hypothetical protein